MNEYFEVVNRANDLLNKMPITIVRESTIADYEAKVKRLIERSKDNPSISALIGEALNTNKKATWQANRAALIYVISDKLSYYVKMLGYMFKILKSNEEKGETANWSACNDFIGRSKICIAMLESILSAELPLEGRIDRHSKRQDMKGLPVDWRERLIKRMPQYAPATITTALTGCRPSELVLGVRFWCKDQMLVAYILGTKVRVENGIGQEWRCQCWSIESSNGMVQTLTKLVIDAGGVLDVSIPSASNFNSAMRRAAQREWPKRIDAVTPYCMRHQAAADMKASGKLTSVEISGALGHRSDVTKRTYGHSNMGHNNGTSPDEVIYGQEIKMIEPLEAAQARTKRLPEQVMSPSPM